MFDDPQVKARGVRVEMPHPVAGKVATVANPMRSSGSPVSYRRPPPGLGEHTQNVMSEVLGLDADEIGRLRAAGVI